MTGRPCPCYRCDNGEIFLSQGRQKCKTQIRQLVARSGDEKCDTEPLRSTVLFDTICYHLAVSQLFMIWRLRCSGGGGQITRIITVIGSPATGVSGWAALHAWARLLPFGVDLLAQVAGDLHSFSVDTLCFPLEGKYASKKVQFTAQWFTQEWDLLGFFGYGWCFVF